MGRRYKFDGITVTDDTKKAVERRVLQETPHFDRFKTNFSDIDRVTGGFPYGLTIAYGSSGSGKSAFCKKIASEHFSLYICAESLIDAPVAPGCLSMDYTKFLPFWEKAINELFVAITEYEPDIVFIDSLTTFLSGTKKAVTEADIREGVYTIAKLCLGIIPIVGISEVRFSGGIEYCAGGRAVDHAAVLLINFNKKHINAPWDASRYGRNIGEWIYTVHIDKDKQGIALQNKDFEIKYKGESIIISELTKTME